jgi:hypothetical protein
LFVSQGPVEAKQKECKNSRPANNQKYPSCKFHLLETPEFFRRQTIQTKKANNANKPRRPILVALM